MTDETRRCPGHRGLTEAHDARTGWFSRNAGRVGGQARVCRFCTSAYNTARRARAPATDPEPPQPAKEEHRVTEPHTNGAAQPSMNDFIRRQRPPSQPAGPPPPGDPAALTDPVDRAVYAEAVEQRFIDPMDAVLMVDRSLLRLDPASGLPINAAGVVTQARRNKAYLLANPSDGMPQPSIHRRIVEGWAADAEAAASTSTDDDQAPTEAQRNAGFNDTIRRAMGRGTTTEGDDQS